MAYTLFDKIWNEHLVSSSAGFPDTLYIDAHVINKITSQRAFESLRKRHVPVFRQNQTIVMTDPGFFQHIPLSDLSRFQLDMLSRNCSDFGIEIEEQATLNHPQGFMAFPGQTIVCDHEHTDNLGALGAIAIGISELQVEQVLAAQCLLQQKPRRMKIEVNGRLANGLSAKDINHYLISEISSEGANGYFIEYAGNTITNLDMDGRMAICNMSREIGAFGGVIAPDETTFDYIKSLNSVPEREGWNESMAYWKTLYSDESSVFDEVLEFDAEDIRPGTYAIGIAKLLPSLSNQDKARLTSFNNNWIINAYYNTDYILSHKEDIEKYERSKSLQDI